MTIIYRKNDFVSLKIGDLIFKIKPLTYEERVEIMSCLSNAGGTVVENAAKATFYSMKYAIKGIDGAFLPDGSKYDITLGDDGLITDDSIDDLLNIELNGLLSKALQNFLRGVPAKIIDPQTKKDLEGVEVVRKGGVPKK